MSETFAARLLRLRLAGGYSRRELAEGAGLAENTVRDYEQGKRQPSLEAAARLAIALGQSLTIWNGLERMATGAYRLPRLSSPPDALDFGQYSGRLPAECDTDYLEWLAREQPAQLKPAQLKAVQLVLRQRRRVRQQGEAEARAAAAGNRRQDRQTRQQVRMVEAEARAAEARAREAEAERDRAEARAQAEECVRQRRLAELGTPPAAVPPKRGAQPRLEDTLPWEESGEPPSDPPPPT